MTMAQVDATAELILMEYSTMTITDLIFVIKRAKLGGFGNLYEGIDGQKNTGLDKRRNDGARCRRPKPVTAEKMKWNIWNSIPAMKGNKKTKTADHRIR